MMERTENAFHFSEILIRDEDFLAIAKVSIYGKAESFFQYLFTLPDETGEKQFDTFCQHVNRQLAKNFDDMVNRKTRTSKGMARRLLGYLQSTAYHSLVLKMIPEELRCHVGLGAVVLTLQHHLMSSIDKYRKQHLNERSNDIISKPQKSRAEIKLMANRFVGYGLAGLINILVEKVGEDEKDDTEDKLHDQLALARSMRIFHEQALILPNYLEECYDTNQAMKNDGYLALLSPQYFCFGEAVMGAVARKIHYGIFDRDGDACLEVAEEAVFAELPKLMESFHLCCDCIDASGKSFIFDDDDENELWCDDAEEPTGTETLSNICLSKVAKEAMVRVIVSKAMHSYFNAFKKLFEQNTTKRKGTDHTVGTFRGNMASITYKAAVAKTKGTSAKTTGTSKHKTK